MLVFLDEAGLPVERHEALKVIHEYLDHPEVACIMLANSNLDAAKLVRGALRFINFGGHVSPACACRTAAFRSHSLQHQRRIFIH